MEIDDDPRTKALKRCSRSLRELEKNIGEIKRD